MSRKRTDSIEVKYPGLRDLIRSQADEKEIRSRFNLTLTSYRYYRRRILSSVGKGRGRGTRVSLEEKQRLIEATKSLSPREAAEQIGCSLASLYGWRRRFGLLPSGKRGRATMTVEQCREKYNRKYPGIIEAMLNGVPNKEIRKQYDFGSCSLTYIRKACQCGYLVCQNVEDGIRKTLHLTLMKAGALLDLSPSAVFYQRKKLGMAGNKRGAPPITLTQFKDRLEARYPGILAVIATNTTNQTIASRFGLSRERIRQIRIKLNIERGEIRRGPRALVFNGLSEDEIRQRIEATLHLSWQKAAKELGVPIETLKKYQEYFGLQKVKLERVFPDCLGKIPPNEIMAEFKVARMTVHRWHHQAGIPEFRSSDNNWGIHRERLAVMTKVLDENPQMTRRQAVLKMRELFPETTEAGCYSFLRNHLDRFPESPHRRKNRPRPPCTVLR